MKYRSDIDGLRAVAVLPVVLFHAGLSGFSGGFVGVDVFFVISGYLITQILYDEVKEGRFSLARFYERRIRRIFPALFAVLAVSAISAYWLLLPEAFEAYGKSLIATTIFASNVLFWRESGYFQSASDEKPLLHTWSLAVEEQFYIFFPIVLLLLWKWWPRRLGAVILCLAVLSFVASAWGVEYKPTATFYLAPFRAWELLIGSLLAVGYVRLPQRRWLREGAAAVGLGLIGYAIFALSSQSSFPGPNALYPCVGAALLIAAGENQFQTATGRLLSTKLMVGVGLISYSLYLWHWPVIVFFKYWSVWSPTMGEKLLMVASSIILGWASWRYVETPYRERRFLGSRRPLFGAAALVSVTAISAGLYVDLAHGIEGRVSSEASTLAAATKSKNPRREECLEGIRGGRRGPPERACVFGADAEPTIAMWGDSHGDAIIYPLGELAAEYQQSIKFLGYAGCAPIVGVHRAKDKTRKCANHNQKTLEYLKVHPELSTVILVGRWSAAALGKSSEMGPAEPEEPPAISDTPGRTLPAIKAIALFDTAIHETVEQLQASGKQVVLVYPIPEVGYDVPATLARLHDLGRPAEGLSVPVARFFRRQTPVVEVLDRLGAQPGILRVYPHRAFCDESYCRVQLNGDVLYRDDDHPSLSGARLIANQFRPLFERLAADAARSEVGS